MRKMTLTREDARRLLYEERKPVTDVAAMLDMHPVSFRQALQRDGIPASYVAWVKELDLTEENLRKFYVEQGYSLAELAEKYGVSTDCIRNALKRHGIELRDGYSDRTRDKQRQKALAQPGFAQKKFPNERGEWQCSACEVWKPQAEFYGSSHGQCKDCVRRRSVEWNRSNKNRVRLRNASALASEFGVVDTLTLAEWLSIVDEFDGRCFYCGDAMYGIEHIVPMSQGGPNSKGNVVPSCRECNMRKQAARTELLETLARIRAIQTGDDDFELRPLSEKSFDPAHAENADALVSAVITRLTLVAA